MNGKLKRLFAPLCLVLALCLLLSGCAKKPSEEDAAAYVQAVMDSICTGAHDSDVAFSDVADGDMAAFRQQLIDEVLDGFRTQASALSEDTVELIRATLSKAFSQCRYTVGEAVKSGDGYDVPVEITPLMLFNVDMEAVQQEAVTQLSSATDLLELTEDQVLDRVFSVMFEMIDADLDDPQYGESTTVTVHYGPLSDGQYGASETDGRAIGESLFSTEGLE